MTEKTLNFAFSILDAALCLLFLAAVLVLPTMLFGQALEVAIFLETISK